MKQASDGSTGGAKLCVERVATQTQMICRLNKESRSTEHVNDIFPVMRL